ncbi:THAP domain-containing protein 2 [Papilio machaon]|uniref:THAP domain-containing protein 2 n=1 Tax=Papilio machaon TaxID=76193 RepID=UPI001E6661F1|nr:THAP domain-containing protein 2 [Papilio machaon]
MPLCSVIGCGIRKTPNQPSLTIHRIPRNELKKKKWLEAIRMENIKTNVKDIYICSLHFDDKCFNKTLDVTRLRDDAVPFKFQHSSQHKTGILKENQLETIPVSVATTVTTPVHRTLDVGIPKLPMTMTAACTASCASVPGTTSVDNLPVRILQNDLPYGILSIDPLTAS